jgi:Flp pilus assembly protein TadG
MSTIAVSNLRARLHRLARRWIGSDEGVAAVEFALIVPIMAVMFIGAVELSQAITADRRVTQIASSTADLVARFSPPNGGANGIPQTEIADIMKVGGYIMAPYDTKPLKIILRSVSSSPTSATNTKQAWICTYTAAGNSLSCSCTNTAYSLPANLVTTLDSVIVSEVTYNYKPLVFDYFLKSMGSGGGPAGTHLMKDMAYLKPRSQTINLLQADNTTPCAAPTF